jgi:hypothetical protein
MASSDRTSVSTSYLKNHTDQRTARRGFVADLRHEPIDGEKIANYLLNLVKEFSVSEDGMDAKWQMFKEIVTRCAFDVVGNAYSVNKNGMKYNGFDNIFEELFKKQKEEAALKKSTSESLYRKVLNCIPLYKKGIVQTPHPTEMLDRDAIQAEIKLHHAIEECSELLPYSIRRCGREYKPILVKRMAPKRRILSWMKMVSFY